jgi:hypothetical protein
VNSERKNRRKDSSTGKRSEQRRDAERYLWHLTPAWRNKFDHDHWWTNNPSKANQEAAVWEVLRRHPKSGDLISEKEPLYQNSPQFEFFLKSEGLLSWPKMSAGDTDTSLFEHWARSLSDLPPQWGIRTRGYFDVEIIQNDEIKELGKRYWDAFRPSHWDRPIDRAALKAARKIWDRSIGPPGSIGGGTNSEAFNALTLGRVLVSFDPCKPGIESIVRKRVREAIKDARRNRKKEPVAGRAYWKEWLTVIAAFETDEMSRITSKENRDDQLFARYRRIIGINKPWAS